MMDSIFNKKTIIFFCFFIGTFYLFGLIYMGYRAYEFLSTAIAGGISTNNKSILFYLWEVFPSSFARVIFVVFLLNAFSLFYIGFLIYKPLILQKKYTFIVLLLLALLIADIFALSVGAFLVFIFGFPFHLIFFIYFLKNKNALINLESPAS